MSPGANRNGNCAASLDGRVDAVDARLTELAGALGATGEWTDAAESRLASVEESAAGASGVDRLGLGSGDRYRGPAGCHRGSVGCDATRRDTVGQQIETITGRLASVDERLDGGGRSPRRPAAARGRS